MKSFFLFFVLIMVALCRPHAQTAEVEQDVFESMRGADKAAIVAVYYGTTDEGQQQRCIAALNAKLQKAFAGVAVFEAWTHQPAVRQMEERGSVRCTLTHVLDQLRAEGFTHVLIQPSSIIDGVEMEYIRHEAAIYVGKFKQLRVGGALLTTPDDYEQTVRQIAAVYGSKKLGNVLVVGGEGGESPAQFAMLDYMLRHLGYDNWFVVAEAEDGFPTVEHLQRRLKQRKQKKLNLIPLTFTSKNTENIDEIRQQLQKAGYKVSLTEHTPGEVDGIQELFVNQAKHTRMFRTYTPLELKMQESLRRPTAP